MHQQQARGDSLAYQRQQQQINCRLALLTATTRHSISMKRTYFATTYLSTPHLIGRYRLHRKRAGITMHRLFNTDKKSLRSTSNSSRFQTNPSNVCVLKKLNSSIGTRSATCIIYDKCTARKPSLVRKCLLIGLKRPHSIDRLKPIKRHETCATNRLKIVADCFVWPIRRSSVVPYTAQI